MSFASTGTETLFAGESTGSEDLKLVRLARHVRGLLIRNPRAHVSVEGYLGRDALQLLPAEVEKERFTVEGWQWETRGKLVGLGVPEPNIRVYVPFQVRSDAAGRTVRLIAHDSAPGPAYPRHAAGVPPVQPFDPRVSASVVVDPTAKQEEGSARAPRHVESQVEVSLWDAKGNRTVGVVPRAKVTLSVGPNGVEEVAGELTAFKARLKALNLAEKFRWGAVSKVEVSVKVEGSMNLDKSTAERHFREWKGKLKATLAFELKIPGTSIALPIEVGPYVDSEGKPGVGVQFTILEFD
jgi:hypothetical protein